MRIPTFPVRPRLIGRACLCAWLRLGAATLPSLAGAADDGGFNDYNAVLHVTGALLESTCNLDMRSAYQEVNLGNIHTEALARPGDQGAPIAVQLTLRRCIRTAGGRRDEQGGAMVWSAAEPVVGITFRAQADADTPALVGVRGAGGFGLRLSDALKRNIELGVRTRAWFVAPGDSVLTYYITPERTSAPLAPGNFHAFINLFLTYD